MIIDIDWEERARQTDKIAPEIFRRARGIVDARAVTITAEMTMNYPPRILLDVNFWNYGHQSSETFAAQFGMELGRACDELGLKARVTYRSRGNLPIVIRYQFTLPFSQDNKKGQE